jgi:hypothetical protein
MFSVDEATASAIQQVFEQSGELSAVVELRRHPAHKGNMGDWARIGFLSTDIGLVALRSALRPVWPFSQCGSILRSRHERRNILPAELGEEADIRDRSRKAS